MLRMIFCFLTIFFSGISFSNEREFLQVEKFGIFTPLDDPGYEYWNSEDFSDQSQFKPFNGAFDLCPYFAYLKNTYNLDVSIETGTYEGDTASFFANLFDQVFTIEISNEQFQKALDRLNIYPNIGMIQGDSPQVLRQILPQLKEKKILFYLDAHWRADWPLLNELNEISQTHKDNCIIVIDDFKIPGRPEFAYDSYNNHECSYEYIREHLDKTFTDYHCFYVLPKNYLQRGKFVAMPKQWKKE